MKLSIIVPFYNAEATLRRCVDSLLAQNVDDCEILLIDDGSTDGSGTLADELSLQNEKICVFHKANGGPSEARNYGIKLVKGEYITFVDSDDEIAPDSLSLLINIMKSKPHCDILEYPVLQKPERSDEFLFNPGDKEYDDALDWLSTFGFEHCWVWNKIYKKNLFLNNVRFPVGKIYEDIDLMTQMLRQNPLIITTSKGLYIYNLSESGLTRKDMKENGLTSLLETQISVVKTLGINTREPRWHRLYLNIFTSQLYSYSKTGKLQLWPQCIAIKKYAGKSDFIKAIMLNIFGLKLSCKIFKLFSKQ